LHYGYFTEEEGTLDTQRKGSDEDLRVGPHVVAKEEITTFLL
jgi:hypothetical protein